MKFFQILDNTDACANMGLIIDLVKFVLNVIQFGIPIFLIVLISIDLFKAMAKGDEKDQKAAQSKAIKRLIYAVVIFLVPALVKFTFGLVPKIFQSDAEVKKDAEGIEKFFTCWDNRDKTSSNSGTSDDSNAKKNCKYYDGDDEVSGKMTKENCDKKNGTWG